MWFTSFAIEIEFISFFGRLKSFCSKPNANEALIIWILLWNLFETKEKKDLSKQTFAKK